MNATAPARLLTVRQVAELLAVKEGKIYLWLAQRGLPRTPLGRAVRIPAEAVERIVRDKTTLAREDR